uniref:5'-deoxynucleotidase HDDC2 n=1 Tax=Canis lupus familiaris TaxID=9615 RepID=A0A8C0PNX3_CANLF
MASGSGSGSGSGSAAALLRFLRQVGQLKRVPRTGWVYRSVERPESVSDHMYRMAVMALVTKDEHLNKDRCVRLALVHDMAESIVGDIAPADNIPKEEKHRREEEAMKQLSQLLPEDLRKELYELWEEYENQSSAEAKFVKQLDQCEMILQASEYEDAENKPGRLQDFFDSTAAPCLCLRQGPGHSCIGWWSLPPNSASQAHRPCLSCVSADTGLITPPSVKLLWLSPS